MTAMRRVEWRGAKVSHLVLGAAQLGMPYGIANTTGQPKEDEAHEIVAAAWQLGVNTFDTAQAYGSSEAVLGSALDALGGGEKALVVTKLSPDLDHTDGHAVRSAVVESCRRLRTNRLWGLMLHRDERIRDWNRGLGRTLLDIKASGLVGHLGVSAYSVDAARLAVETPGIDLIQLPCNAWDRRMAVAGVFEDAKRQRKLCLVRSVYLQGLLTVPPETPSAGLPDVAADAALRWCSYVKARGTTAIVLALRYALSLGAPLVIGAETVAQVKENIALANSETRMEPDEVKEMSESLGPIDDRILDPRCWGGLRRAGPTGRSWGGCQERQ